MKKILVLLLFPLALLAQVPQNVQKLSGTLSNGGFHVPTGATVDATGSGVIHSTSVNSGTAQSLTGWSLRSTGAAFDLSFSTSEALSANRNVTWNVGNAARAITMSGNPTLADWFDQAVKAASTPAFAGESLTAASTWTAVAAPSTPAAGRGAVYVDSTSKNLAVKDDAGVVKHGVQTAAAVTHQFLTAINDAGAATQAQPAVADVSGFGTGVATALGVNVGTAGSVVVNGGALGTPSAGVGTNLTATKASVLNGDTLSVTYTGTPPFPLYIDLTAPAVAGITGAGTGSPVTMTAVAQKGANTINYNEGGVATPLGNYGITAITFNDLQFVVNLLAVSNMTNCTTIAFPELLWVGGSVSLAGGGTGVTTTMPSLTTVSLPKLQYAVGTFNVGGSTSLTTLSCPELLSCAAFTCQNLSAVTTFSFPKLQAVTALFAPINFATLTTLSFPALTDVGGTSGVFGPANYPLLTTFDFPVLKTINTNCSPATMASLTTLSFPALQYIGGAFAPATMAACTTVSLPSMVTYGATVGSSSNITIPSASMAAVTTVTLGTIGTLKTVNGAAVTLSGLALNQASVDGVLKLLASLDGTGGTTSFGTGKTVTLTGGTNASPTTSGTTATTPAGSSFVGVGTTCTATITTHGLSSGDIITTTGITTLTNANVTAATVTVLNANQFTFTIVSQTATGTGTASMHSTPAAGTDGFHACQVIRLRGATVTTALGF